MVICILHAILDFLISEKRLNSFLPSSNSVIHSAVVFCGAASFLGAAFLPLVFVLAVADLADDLAAVFFFAAGFFSVSLVSFTFLVSSSFIFDQSFERSLLPLSIKSTGVTGWVPHFLNFVSPFLFVGIPVIPLKIFHYLLFHSAGPVHCAVHILFQALLSAAGKDSPGALLGAFLEGLTKQGWSIVPRLLLHLHPQKGPSIMKSAGSLASTIRGKDGPSCSG